MTVVRRHAQVSTVACLLDVLMPTRCAVCARPVRTTVWRRAPGICAPCLAALPWWRRVDGCPRCGTPRPLEASPGDACRACLARGSALHTCHALFRYEGALRRWLPGFKRRARGLGPPLPLVRVVEQLARCQAEHLTRSLAGQLDLVVGVPLHPRRRRHRGFDHVDPVARRIATGLGLPFAPQALERVRDTAPQASLSGEARLRNLRGAFRARPALPTDARVGLVDDVLTTGSTLEAAADALLEAGALEVRGITLAATLPAARRRR